MARLPPALPPHSAAHTVLGACERRQGGPGHGRESGEGEVRCSWGRRAAPRHLPIPGLRSLQEEAKAKEEEGVPDEEGWVKVTRRGRRPVLPRTEAASLRVLEREKRKRARKELLNFYAWQHRETKMERKGAPQAPVLRPPALGAQAVDAVLWPLCQPWPDTELLTAGARPAGG